jgi:molecular chaperone IbpA
MPVVGAEEEQVSSAAAEGVNVPSERAKDPSVRETQEGELAKKTSNEGMWTTGYEAGEQARPEGKPGHVILFGFDRVMRMLENSMQWSEAGNGYPPYSIEKTGDDRYRITLAVAGFDENELAVKVRENVLLVEGRKREAEAATTYLYRGIAGRSFKRQFQLADFVKVVNAHLHNGLLIIDLVRELPEAMKPRRIEISTSEATALAGGNQERAQIESNQH